MGKLNAREKADRAATRRRAGLRAAKTRKSRPKTPSLEQLLRPLTPTQEAGIREALLDDAPHFLRDWGRISAVGYHYANEQRKNEKASSKSNKKLLAEETKAVRAALKALKSLDKQLEIFNENWVPIWKTWYQPRLDNHDNSEVFFHAVKEFTKSQQEKVEGYGTKRGIFRPGRRGAPTSPTRYFLEVMLAYFRDRQWDAHVPPADLSNDKVVIGVEYKESDFVKVALVLLRHTSENRGMRPPTRKALAASSLNYAALEKDTPVLSRDRRARLSATDVSRPLL
ncbi:hypothetical protein JYU09_00525 [bacterium AH-315-O15]|nr:hypothetical protein [bacterium AH-315-O15]